jgi:sortase A
VPADARGEADERAVAGKRTTIMRTVGEVLITLGIVVLLFVVHELYVTNWTSAKKQDRADAELADAWSRASGDPVTETEPTYGNAFARLYIPAFGDDYRFTVQAGMDLDSLAIGPGHYGGTAMPGEPGNFGVAGHRIGKGAPFNDLDALESCDAIVVETASDFYVYRVLPMDDELAEWAQGRGRDPRCANVPTLRDLETDDQARAGGESMTGEDSPYSEVFGRRIVEPSRGDAVAPVPYRAAAQLPTAQQAALVTLTTCHPEFSDRERMIVHGVLVNQFRKAPGSDTYGQLLDQIGGA